MIGPPSKGCQTRSRARRGRARGRGGGPGGRRAAVRRAQLAILPGGIAESPCEAPGAVLSFGTPGPFDGPSRSPDRGASEHRPAPQPATFEPIPGVRRTTLATSGRPSIAAHPREPSSTNGCEAGLASRARRAPGIALPGELRDVAARHDAHRCRRQPLPDRGPQRLRQGLAGEPLSTVDLPDPRPNRGLQRPGRVRGRDLARFDDRGRRRRRAGARAPGSGAAAGHAQLPARPGGGDAGRRRGRHDQHQQSLHLRQLHRRLGQPPRPRGEPLGRRAPGPRLQPALPVRRGGPRQDPSHACHRQPGRGQVPSQAGRLRHQREVHQRVHHLDPAGQDRRLPGPLPADRPPPHRCSTPFTRTASRSS
jgi:hypothetical protein